MARIQSIDCEIAGRERQTEAKTKSLRILNFEY